MGSQAVVQLFECLLSMQEALGLIPSTLLLHILVHVCTPSTWLAEAGESGVEGHPSLYRGFEANLEYLMSSSTDSTVQEIEEEILKRRKRRTKPNHLTLKVNMRPRWIFR